MLLKQVKEKQEIQTVAKLAEKIWHAHYDSIIGAAQVDYMLQKFQSEDAVALQLKDGMIYKIAWWENAPAGYYAIKKEPDAGKIFLSKLYIDKAYRKKGIATAILQDILKIGEESDLSGIYLTVNKNNKGSIEAYEKLGFHKEKEIKTDIGNGFFMDDYIMER